MTQTTINRRRALAVVAAAPAAVAIGSTALANTGEDAELLRLWEEWKAERVRCEEAIRYFEEIEVKVANEAGPHWEFAKADYEPSRAVFISSWHGDASLKIVPIKFKTHAEKLAAIDEAQRDLGVERERLNKASKRKHKWASANRAVNRAHARVRDIEDEIAEMPAEGLTGIAVKLALWYGSHYDFTGEEALPLLVSTYEATVKLAGLPDLAAQVDRW
jgi:hypothetical protein